jgi:hypothetical protein
MLAGSFLAACGGWLRTGHYDVEENVAVISHMFNLTVRDASTDRLMTSAFAEAHWVEDARITNLTIADDSGKIQLEVLPGAFGHRGTERKLQSRDPAQCVHPQQCP